MSGDQPNEAENNCSEDSSDCATAAQGQHFTTIPRRRARLPVLRMVIGGLAMLAYGYLLLDVAIHPFGMRVGHVILGFLPAIVGFNCAVAVLQKLADRRFNREDGHSKKSILPKLLCVVKWVGTPLAFFIGTGLIEVAAQYAEAFHLSRDLRPLVECLSNSAVDSIASTDDVLRCLRACDQRHGVNVGVGYGRFVLRCRGGSVDMDGSTWLYDSDAGRWRNCHNDILYQTNVFASAEAAMQYWVSDAVHATPAMNDER